MTTPPASGQKEKRGTSASVRTAGTFDAAISSLLQTSSLACIVTNEFQEIQSWNSGAEALLGWKAAEVLHKPLSSVLSENDFDHRLKAVGGEPNSSHPEFSFRKKNGEISKIQIWSSVLPASLSKESGRLLLLQDVTEKKFLEEALLEASEREQRRIGQELHDHLCQHLLGAAFAAKALAGALDREHSAQAPQLHDLARLINDAVTQVRDISRGLHPVELDAAGLMSALQELANRAGQMTECTFHCERGVLVKDAGAALNAYRIAQATVTAALHETGAKKIEILLGQSSEAVCLTIRDNGKKESELTANPAGVAAKTLQYRARAMRGSLQVKFDPKNGTCVTCLLPL